MNIDEIEDNLNNYESNLEKVVEQILNLTAQNNAMIRVMLDNQLTMMKLIDTSIDANGMEKQVDDKVAIYLAQLQAFLSSKLGEE